MKISRKYEGVYLGDNTFMVGRTIYPKFVMRYKMVDNAVSDTELMAGSDDLVRMLVDDDTRHDGEEYVRRMTEIMVAFMHFCQCEVTRYNIKFRGQEIAALNCPFILTRKNMKKYFTNIQIRKKERQ